MSWYDWMQQITNKKVVHQHTIERRQHNSTWFGCQRERYNQFYHPTAFLADVSSITRLIKFSTTFNWLPLNASQWNYYRLIEIFNFEQNLFKCRLWPADADQCQQHILSTLNKIICRRRVLLLLLLALELSFIRVSVNRSTRTAATQWMMIWLSWFNSSSSALFTTLVKCEPSR